MKSHGCWIQEAASVREDGTLVAPLRPQICENRAHCKTAHMTGRIPNDDQTDHQGMGRVLTVIVTINGLGWRGRPTVHHWVSILVRSDCGRVHVVERPITERTIKWRDSTLSEPFSHSLNGAAGTHTKRTRRDNLQSRAQITERSNQRTRKRGHHARHIGWKRRTISDGHGSNAPEEGQQPTCDKPLRVRPDGFQVNCSSWRPARPPQQTATPTFVLHHPEAVQRELTQNIILHPTTHSARRQCGRRLTQMQEADVQSDTKIRTERRGDCRAKSVCECGEVWRAQTPWLQIWWSHTRFEAPLPGPRCYDVAGHLQIVAHNPPPPRGHQHRVGQRSDGATRGARRVPTAERDAPIRT